MTFLEYDTFEDCKAAHSEYVDPGAFSVAMYHHSKGEWPTADQMGVGPDEHLDLCLTAAGKMDLEPSDELLGAIKAAGGWPEEAAAEKSLGERLASWLTGVW